VDLVHGIKDTVKMPLLGFGTWPMKGKIAGRSVKVALEAGYRLIDTAKYYNNEEAVGKAIKESEVPREDIFVTTKLWSSDHGYEKALEAFEASLDRLGLDYIDLYLIHWPDGGDHNEDTWLAFEELLATDELRGIGVSNYEVQHLKDLMEASETLPAVNQIQLSPFVYQAKKEVIEFCWNHDIRIEAYSPITKGQKLDDQKLLALAGKYDKTAAQVLIRWGLQHQFIVIPKSSQEKRIHENKRVYDFQLSKRDMEILDSLEG